MDVHGRVDDGYGKIADAFRANFSEYGDVGAGFCLYVGGEPVVDITGGSADPKSGRAYDERTLQLVFSTTKGAAAVCAAILVDDGLLDYDKPVAEYWPEFAQAGKGEIPVSWILSHRAGLAAVDNPPPLEDVLRVNPIVEALAAQRPLWEPGTEHGYHALTYGWLVGELVKRISGKSIGAFLRERVADPLGLDFWIGLPESEESRVSPLIAAAPPSDPADLQLMMSVMGPGTMGGRALSLDGVFGLTGEGNVFNTRGVHASEMPAANGITNASSLARMYAATLAPVDGVQLVSDATRELATTPVTSGPDKSLVIETKFGMGFMCPDGVLPLTGPRAFGHAGAGGSIGFADPDLGIGYGYVMNQMTGSLVGDPRTEGLTAAVLSCVG